MRRNKKIAKKTHPWKIYNRRKINMKISQRLLSSLKIITLIKSLETLSKVWGQALNETYEYATYISQLEPKNFKKAKNEKSLILAMQEELGQFERNKVWTLVPRPSNYPIIGTKRVFRNKMNELGNVVRNKARLVV